MNEKNTTSIDIDIILKYYVIFHIKIWYPKVQEMSIVFFTLSKWPYHTMKILQHKEVLIQYKQLELIFYI